MPTDDAVRTAATRRRDAPDPQQPGVGAFLYRGEGEDREVEPDGVSVDDLADDDLLWVDVDSSSDGAVEQAARLVSLDADELRPGAEARPSLRDSGDSFVLGVVPLRTDQDPSGSEVLVCAVGRNWLVTVHDRGVGSLHEFGEHLGGDSARGRLDAPSFLAQLLEWVLNAYFDHLDELQREIDDLEIGILRRRQGGAAVERLVELRHDVGELRRRLSPHRQVLAMLAHPAFDVLSSSSAAEEFHVLVDRLETALQTADTTREMIVEAFDVFMTQTAQRTNDIMRVLTMVSVALLPATLIAGVFGMNMLPKYLLHTWVYWAALVLMVVVSGLLVLVVQARFRRQ
jgi:magnesium transporter